MKKRANKGFWVIVLVLVSLFGWGCGKSECESICTWQNDCVDSIDIDWCIDSCQTDWSNGGDQCQTAITELAECYDSNSCAEAIVSCVSEVAEQVSSCSYN